MTTSQILFRTLCAGLLSAFGFLIVGHFSDWREFLGAMIITTACFDVYFLFQGMDK